MAAAVGATAVILGSGVVIAADTAPITVTSGTDRGGLEEIVVTAQRRSENLERTPVAVTVISGDTLQKQNIVSESDLRSEVSGLTVRSSANSNQLNYSLRGQTEDAFSGSTPAVLPYINEVSNGGSTASAFYDLQSVQVLKGPQGTLFGRNTTGGAVLFTTTKPTNEWGGYISASTGNYALQQYEGAFNAPLIDETVLLRVASYYESHKGYQFNEFTDHTVGDVNRFGGRASLTVKLSDSFKNDTVIDYQHSGGSSLSLVLTYVAPPGSNNAPIPANLLYSPFADVALGAPGFWAAFIAANPKLPYTGLTGYQALQAAKGPFNISVNNSTLHNSNNLVTSNITSIDLTPSLQLRNIIGFNNLDSEEGEDYDGSPFELYGCATGRNYCISRKIQEITEEPQLIGKLFSDKLSFVSGLYYSHDSSIFLNDLAAVGFSPLASYLAQPEFASDARDTSYAIYSQGTYDLSQASGVQGLSVTAGARYTHETVTLTQLPQANFYDKPPPFQNELGRTDNKVSWQFGVQEQLDPDTLLYIVSRRSFRSGGFNPNSPPFPGTGNSGGAGFESETATDVELGAKFQGSAFGVPSRLNVAVYSEWIDNIQRVAYTDTIAGPSGFTTNVPKTRVSGVETDALISPWTWLNLGGSVNYINAAFTDNQVTLPGANIVTVGFGPYSDTPKWSGTLYSDFNVHVTGRLVASLHAELFDQAKNFFSSTNNTITPGTEIPAYAVTNFRLGLEDEKAGWSVAATLKNAFNRVYYVGGIAGLDVFTSNAEVPGDPRTYQVTVRYKF